MPCVSATPRYARKRETEEILYMALFHAIHYLRESVEDGTDNDAVDGSNSTLWDLVAMAKYVVVHQNLIT